MKKHLLFFIALAMLGAICCNKDTSDPIDSVSQDSTPYELNTWDLPLPPIAEDNQLTNTGVDLGRRLFYDDILSLDQSMNCASCHQLEGEGFAVGPDLTALTDKSTPALIRAILDPNYGVEDRFSLPQCSVPMLRPFAEDANAMQLLCQIREIKIHGE